MVVVAVSQSMPLLIPFGFFVLIVAAVLLGSHLFGPDSWPIQSDRRRQSALGWMPSTPRSYGNVCAVPCLASQGREIVGAVVAGAGGRQHVPPFGVS